MQFFLKKGSPMPLRREALGIKWRVALRICALGVAPSVMELGFAVSNMIMNNLLLSYGASDPLGSDGALAVMRVLSAVGMFTIMPSMGIAMGAQPIIGYNYGARKFGRMKRTLGQGILLGIAITTPLWLTVLFLPDMYAHLFSLPEAYLDATAWALIAYLVFIPILPVALIGSNYFDATGAGAARRRCSRSRARYCSSSRCSWRAPTCCRSCCPGRRCRACSSRRRSPTSRPRCSWWPSWRRSGAACASWRRTRPSRRRAPPPRARPLTAAASPFAVACVRRDARCRRLAARLRPCSARGLAWCARLSRSTREERT